MSEHMLKGTLLGGFKRSDVMEYIERSARENGAIITALKTERDELRQERDDLCRERDALAEEKAALLETGGQLEAATAELAELRTALAASEASCDELRCELEQLRPDWVQYQAIRNHLSVLQIEACRRASELEEDARRRMRQLEDETYGRLQALTAQCRAAIAASYPAVFDELDQLLRREAPETAAVEAEAEVQDDVLPELEAEA